MTDQKECIKALPPGNTLIVWKLDRLGRNMKDLVNMVDTLCKKEVGFKVLEGAEIDTNTKNGRMIFGIFAALAEYERELIKERTKAGLEVARARKGGRPRKMDRAALRMAAMQNREAKPSEIAKKLNITTTTLYEYVNGDGTLKEKGVIVLGDIK
ncbi:recombinase family protein [Candidatus Cyrtobacter comes]|nr:recombinase family protein [Candidatus Cyrtobacter comes]